MYCRPLTIDDIFFMVTLYNGKDICVNENDGRIWKRLYDEKNKKHTTDADTKSCIVCCGDSPFGKDKMHKKMALCGLMMYKWLLMCTKAEGKGV